MMPVELADAYPMVVVTGKAMPSGKRAEVPDPDGCSLSASISATQAIAAPPAGR